jgi:hypothetical protein
MLAPFLVHHEDVWLRKRPKVFSRCSGRRMVPYVGYASGSGAPIPAAWVPRLGHYDTSASGCIHAGAEMETSHSTSGSTFGTMTRGSHSRERAKW